MIARASKLPVNRALFECRAKYAQSLYHVEARSEALVRFTLENFVTGAGGSSCRFRPTACPNAATA
jgi:hypothetical protein